MAVFPSASQAGHGAVQENSTDWKAVEALKDGIQSLRSQRTMKAYRRVFRPLMWNVPLVVVFGVVALTVRPSFNDAVAVIVLATLFGVMCLATTISISRLPALKRSEREDKENLAKGLKLNRE